MAAELEALARGDDGCTHENDPSSTTASTTSARGRCYVVWGSSVGWLVFFGCLAYGWRSRGVEILGCLVEEARQAEEYAGPLAAGQLVIPVCMCVFYVFFVLQ